jgi:lipopolysaccharide export system protein LptA
VVQGDTVLQSGKMIVYYGGGGSVTAGATDIEKIEVSGGVVLQSGNQTATADRGLFNMVAQTLVLTGKEVVLSQGDNILVGCKLTVTMQTGDAQVDSCKGDKVKFLIDPKSAQQ